MRQFSYITVTALFLSACTVGPDYEAPEINAPQNFVSQDVLSVLNESHDDARFAAQWWEGFNDPVLTGLVDDGLEDNYDIAAAAARVKQARANVRLADAGDNLTAAAGGDGEVQERRNLNGDDNASTTTSITGVLGAVLPLDIFGQTKREVEAARANLAAARADLNSIILDTSSGITGEYLQLRGSQRQLELLRESVDLQEKTLEIVRSRFEAGIAPELDLQRARTSVANLRADIPPLEEELLNSRNRLARLSGSYAGAYEELLSNVKDLPDYESGLPELVPLEVIMLRPDVALAEANLKQAVANIGVAEAEFYPEFELSSQISIGSTGVSGARTTDVLIASLGAMIDQVITAGGARQANLDIAEAQAEEALANFEQTLRLAVEDVETVLAAIRSSVARQVSLEEAVASSERSFFQAETLYQQGLISFLDVVDAQRVLASAEQQLARERTNYAVQIANLFRVLGVQDQLDVTPAQEDVEDQES